MIYLKKGTKFSPLHILLFIPMLFYIFCLIFYFFFIFLFFYLFFSFYGKVQQNNTKESPVTGFNKHTLYLYVSSIFDRFMCNLLKQNLLIPVNIIEFDLVNCYLTYNHKTTIKNGICTLFKNRTSILLFDWFSLKTKKKNDKERKWLWQTPTSNIHKYRSYSLHQRKCYVSGWGSVTARNMILSDKHYLVFAQAGYLCLPRIVQEYN